MSDDSDTSYLYSAPPALHDTSGNSERKNTDWQNRLPYAYAYLRKTVFTGCKDDLRMVANWNDLELDYEVGDVTLSEDGVDVHVNGSDMVARLASDEPDIRAPVFYWETEYRSRRGSGPTEVHIGTDGRISWCNGAFELDCGFDKFSVKAGDVIGCGNLLPHGFFYTKNGTLLNGSIIPGWNRAQMTITCRQFSLAIIHTNFGQEPFKFEIETFCTQRFTPMLRLAVLVPQEILELILSYALAYITNDIERTSSAGNVNPTVATRIAERDWSRLSSVCRRWRAICLDFTFKGLALYSLASLAPALRRNIRRCNRLSTCENSPRPWLHCFFASPLPPHLVSVSEWVCQSGHPDPPILSRFPRPIYPLLRHQCFGRLRKLELQGVHFPTWLQFARFVMGFQRIEALVLKETSWQDCTPCMDNPPRWLRWTARIRSISLIPTRTRPYHWRFGALLLLLVGNPTRSTTTSTSDLILPQESVPATLALVKLFCRMCDFQEIRYDASSAQQCTITCFHAEKSRLPDAVQSEPSESVLTLQFKWTDSIWILSYASLCITRHDCEDFASRFGALFPSLSNSNHCRFRFDLRRYPSGFLDFQKHLIGPEAMESAALNRILLRRRIYQEAWGLAVDGRVEVIVEPDTADFTKSLAVNYKYFSHRVVTLLDAHRRRSGGDVAVVIWDSPAEVHGCLTFSWMRLFRSTDLNYGEQVADIAYQVQHYPALGMTGAKFRIPNIPRGMYFLAGRVNVQDIAEGTALIRSYIHSWKHISSNREV